MASALASTVLLRHSELAVDSFILADILVNFLKEHIKDVKRIKYLKEGVIFYLKTFFIVDILSVIPVISTIERDIDLYWFKILRLIRIGRYFEFFNIIRKFVDHTFRTGSSKHNKATKIINLIYIVTTHYFVCHVFACVWLFIGLKFEVDT